MAGALSVTHALRDPEMKLDPTPGPVLLHRRFYMDTGVPHSYDRGYVRAVRCREGAAVEQPHLGRGNTSGPTWDIRLRSTNSTKEHDSRSRAKFRILDDDQPTISLSVNSTSVTEGDAVTFTLTRGRNTTEDLIVGVSVDDPGGFLEGNFSTDAITVPSGVVFAPGDVTKSVALTPPDDWRDISNSALTFTVMVEPEYEIVGSASLTVQVTDNDVAPQVQISFNHAEVNEGSDLVLSITRMGEDRNPIDIPLTAGPMGNQEYTVNGMDAGQSLLHIVYSRPDDRLKSPDVVYEATLHPERPEFWTATGQTTITSTVLDNDPYRVGVEAVSSGVDEGQILYYRVFHDGHAGESLRIKVEHSESGSAVADSRLGQWTHTIPSGSSSNTRGFPAEANDGSDGNATFIIELLPSDDYEIDPNHTSASITVLDKDPLPAVEFPTLSEYVDEGDGNAEIPVDLASLLPVLRTVTVDYQVIEGAPRTAPI